jgi:hypothetical protein
MSVGNFTTTAIITKGLTCSSGSTCRNGIITTFFSLYYKQPSTGGGGYPKPAWNKVEPGQLKNFYKPVPEEYYLLPRDKEIDFFSKKKIVVMKINIGNINIEKEYSISETKSRKLIKVLNILNSTISNIEIGISNIKRFFIDVSIKIKNLNNK